VSADSGAYRESLFMRVQRARYVPWLLLQCLQVFALRCGEIQPTMLFEIWIFISKLKRLVDSPPESFAQREVSISAL
jgi:hypothetical protein